MTHPGTPCFERPAAPPARTPSKVSTRVLMATPIGVISCHQRFFLIVQASIAYIEHYVGATSLKTERDRCAWWAAVLRIVSVDYCFGDLKGHITFTVDRRVFVKNDCIYGCSGATMCGLQGTNCPRHSEGGEPAASALFLCLFSAGRGCSGAAGRMCAETFVAYYGRIIWIEISTRWRILALALRCFFV